MIHYLYFESLLNLIHRTSKDNNHLLLAIRPRKRAMLQLHSGNCASQKQTSEAVAPTDCLLGFDICICLTWDPSYTDDK